MNTWFYDAGLVICENYGTKWWLLILENGVFDQRKYIIFEGLKNNTSWYYNALAFGKVDTFLLSGVQFRDLFVVIKQHKMGKKKLEAPLRR